MWGNKLLRKGEFVIAGLQKYGYMAYPKECVEEGAKCRFMLNLHGCGMDALDYAQWTELGFGKTISQN